MEVLKQNMVKKNAVFLDTSSLMKDAECLFLFGSSDVFISHKVLEELDGLKESSNYTKSYKARKAVKQINSIIDNNYKIGKYKGKLNFISSPENNLSQQFNLSSPDNVILNDFFYLNKKEDYKSKTFITEDVNLKVKTLSLGLDSSTIPQKKEEEFYSGLLEITVSNDVIDKLYRDKQIDNFVKDVHENQCITLSSATDKSSALCVYSEGFIKLISDYNNKFFKKAKILDFRMQGSPQWFSPKNKEQRYAMNFLLDKNIPLVTLLGISGVGKTALSISSALYETFVMQNYKKILITRPIQPMGNDIGFLKGSKEEKLMSWVAPFIDNLEHIFGEREIVDDLMDSGLIELEAPTFIRGRSLSDCFIIVDESQNLSKHEIKTILTRVGYGSKIVLTGDIEQIDSLKLNKENNGLSYVVDKFKNYKECGHIVMTKGERSPLATLSAKIL